jgi:hypothetical protein
VKTLGLKQLLFHISLFCLFACVNGLNEESLFGVWVGEKDGVEIVLTFSRDSTSEIIFKDGSNVTKLTGYFQVDFSKRPIPLTIRNIPNLNHPLHTIIQFEELDLIRISKFGPRLKLRPIGFNRETEIYLRRSKIGA